MIQVSVIVPFHNSERYLRQCIEGLVSQSYPPDRFEILMINNNSADSSAEIVRQYPRIRLLSEPRQGAYAARNRGLREARGEIIAFTDADCIPSDRWLQEIAAAMERSDIGIVLGNRQIGDNSFLLSLLAAYEHEKHKYVFTNDVKELYYGHTNNMAVRRNLFDELGPFVEQARGSDTIFVRRAVDRYSCATVQYIPEMQVQHREIDSVGKFYQKVFTYGRSSRGYSRIVRTKMLSNRERVLVYCRAVRTQRYSWLESAILLGLLSAGSLFWILGNAGGLRQRQENPS